jgi:diaminobutyrate-2-oxoglutarate transaminase
MRKKREEPPVQLGQFHDVESAVRYYCRKFPAIFDKARGAELFDTEGQRYIDFFGGAGALNYGHNHPHLKQAVIDYLSGDGVIHSLDLATGAKERFLQKFAASVLRSRGLGYRVQFPGPTGTNAVEAAIKLARKVTGRSSIVSFTGAFHGVTIGSLALTASAGHRAVAGVPLVGAVRMPYDGFLGSGDDLGYLEGMLTRPGSGLERPAGFILETVQGEGGLNVASGDWLRGVEALARSMGALLIVDDIMAGCGRTGTFFSFEPSGIKPDLVCLSKSLSGVGLPMSVVLIRPDRDEWKPGEHNGTFRGNNLAFVSAAASLDFWEDPGFHARLRSMMAEIERQLAEVIDHHRGARLSPKGRGALRGIEVDPPEIAALVQRAAFRRGLLLETSGPDNSVLKLLPPLNVEPDILSEGIAILNESLTEVLEHRGPAVRGGNHARIHS